MWNMPLKTSVSLHGHQIFTVLYYSGLAVWQKCIMWTSCGWHGNIGSCNNGVARKIENDQMYQQEINNWKLLILVWSAPQSSGRQTMLRGFAWKQCLQTQEQKMWTSSNKVIWFDAEFFDGLSETCDKCYVMYCKLAVSRLKSQLISSDRCCGLHVLGWCRTRQWCLFGW